MAGVSGCPRCDASPSCPRDAMGWCHTCQREAALREGTEEGMGVCHETHRLHPSPDAPRRATLEFHRKEGEGL